MVCAIVNIIPHNQWCRKPSYHLLALHPKKKHLGYLGVVEISSIYIHCSLNEMIGNDELQFICKGTLSTKVIWM